MSKKMWETYQLRYNWQKWSKLMRSFWKQFFFLFDFDFSVIFFSNFTLLYTFVEPYIISHYVNNLRSTERFAFAQGSIFGVNFWERRISSDTQNPERRMNARRTVKEIRDAKWRMRNETP